MVQSNLKDQIDLLGIPVCQCVGGYTPDPANPSRCIDLDECSANNGDCQHKCHNAEGSYSCSCDKGYQVVASNPTRCEDIDECSGGEHGCSHNCLNTEAGFKCACPRGYLLKFDQKTCKAAPGAPAKPQKCPSIPRPEHGFMRCTKRKVGGLFPVNTRCKLRCRSGLVPTGPMRKRCHTDGTWFGPDATCTDIKKSASPATTTTTTTISTTELATTSTTPDTPPTRQPSCPTLILPANISVYPSSCTESDSIPPGARCSFVCSGGFRMDPPESRSLRCQVSGSWDIWPPPQCVGVGTTPTPQRTPQNPPLAPKPFIICPPDVMKPLIGKASSAYVMFPQPKTNVNWFR